MLSKLTPIALAFFVIVIGYLIGKIKMYHITFDVSAILIVAAITGYILSRFSPATIDDAFINDMGLLSKLGTYIFVSSIGLFSGFSISKGFNRKNLVCFFIGSFMVCSGYISMKLISLFDTQMDQSLLFGILCGSLTSTPGLAAVCENKWITAEFATLGYGCSYLLGVISTVLFVQLMTMNTPEITNTSVENYRTTQKKSDRYGEIHCNKILDTISPTAIITDTNSELKVTHMIKSKYKEPAIHPAIIMCTSGTTGKPKGAMLTEDNILTNVYDICDYFKIASDDSILIARPLYHCAVLTGEFLTSLIKGVRIYFYSGQFNPKIITDLIFKHNITVFCGTPTIVNVIARFNRKNTYCPLRVMCISGECMSKETGEQIVEAFSDVDIYHVYGLTEACPRVSYLPPYLFKNNADSVGIPLNSVFIKILRQDGLIANINEEGMLWVKGDNVMSGYYDSPEQTAEVLKNGWLCTGDIALVDSNGLLKIKGRNDELIIRAGMNIYPQEIEGVLKIDSRVEDVLAYKIENSKSGVQIGLKISGNFVSTDEVRKLCNESLPSFQIPMVIELLEELPKNGSGKIIRRR